MQISFAQYRSGPTALSLGGAGVAAVDPNESPLMNPASLGHINYNYLSFGFQSEREVSGDLSEKGSATVIDASNDVIATGAITFVKNRHRFRSDDILDEKFYSLGLGKLLLGSLSLGFSFHRLERSLLGEETAYHTADFGLMYSPTPDLGLALVAYNFVGSGEQFLPSSYTVGMHYMYKKLLRFRLDFQNWEGLESVDDKNQTKFGMEIPMGKWFALRTGYIWDGPNDRELFTTGFGWLGPRLRVLYAYQNNSERPKELLHSLDMQLFF